jgi:hypothetical protein
MPMSRTWEVKPRLSGLGEVIVDVVCDGAIMGTARCPTELTAYTGAHALAPAIADAVRAAYLCGLQDGDETPPTEPSPTTRPKGRGKAA